MSIKTVTSPLYEQYFSQDHDKPANWEDFKNPHKPFTDQSEEFTAPLSSRSIDFSTHNTSWKATAKSVAKLALKFVVISYVFYSFGGSHLMRGVAISFNKSAIFTRKCDCKFFNFIQ